MKRLGLLVIGDEILAGHTQDTNSHWLAKRLKAMGVSFARIETCTDDLADIKASVRRFLGDLHLDYVITSGGLGPTHDDRTMEGIAAAIGVDLELTPANETWMRQHVQRGHEYGYYAASEPNEGHLKMAYLPEGAEAMPNHMGTCLGAIIQHKDTLLFTLPGVPREFERMFDESVAPRLEAATPLHVEELRLYTEESRMYRRLEAAEAAHPGVTVGSYPQRGHILIRATGPEAEAKALIAALRQQAAEYLEPHKRA